jgi:hypothetical protein
MQPIGTLFMKQMIDNQMIRMMKSILFFLIIVSFSRCDMKTTGYPIVRDSTMQYDTSDLAITIVHNPKFAYGVEVRSKNATLPITIRKIMFAAGEVNYSTGCESKPYSKCSSEYCYLPTLNSASRLPFYLNGEGYSKPLCKVYYQVGKRTKIAAADSVSLISCKIEAAPGMPEPNYPCYWLNGCND